MLSKKVNKKHYHKPWDILPRWVLSTPPSEPQRGCQYSLYQMPQILFTYLKNKSHWNRIRKIWYARYIYLDNFKGGNKQILYILHWVKTKVADPDDGAYLDPALKIKTDPT